MRPAFHNGALRIPAVITAMALVIAIPFFLKPKENLLARADDTLVVITPHNEAIRYEFASAFSARHRARTGRTVRIDWRLPGGTSEIARYLQGEFHAAFERKWRSGGRAFTPEVAGAFDNPKIQAAADSATPAQAARHAFLQSDTGIGIDVFFGGGGFDFEQQAAAGRLVASDVIRAHPDWFTGATIPQSVSGEIFYDPGARWIGACLSSFGICYNTDSLRRLGIREIPASWRDLTQPQFFKQVALADPTKSGSAAKAFEMVIQQQMQQLVRETGSDDALAAGWSRGLEIIQAASANARYFTDAAGKVPLDVSLGDAAIGLCIDFYGRYQSEAVKVGNTASRLQYFTPEGGSSVGVDPIGILRGAPNRAVAEEFLAFVLSPEGQKLWNFRVGTPGGPTRYALRRLPIRKELYTPEFAAFRSDPGVQPYEEAKLFTYHPAWTGPLFKTMSFIIRVMCLDSHEEQTAAWKALIEAKFPRGAMEKFSDVSAVNYEAAWHTIRPVLASQNRIDEVRLAKELGKQFRQQYREAERLAREGK